MDLENPRRVVKNKILKFPCTSSCRSRRNVCNVVESDRPEKPLYDPILDIALKKKVRCLVKLVHFVQQVEWQGSFIMSLWTWYQKYVFHRPGRSEEVLWLSLEQSGHSSDLHGLMTKDPIRVSLSWWLTLVLLPTHCKISTIQKTPPWSLESRCNSGEMKGNVNWQLNFAVQWLCTWRVHASATVIHLVAIYSNSQPCHQQKITF